jgi:hypothetical protein
MGKESLICGALLLTALAGCAPSPPLATACHAAGADRALVAQLFFGRGITGRAPLTDAEWDDFAATTITPHLPDGFTVFDSQGQWLNPDTHSVAREGTKVLEVAFDGSPVKLQALREVADAYRVRFHQISVGLILTDGCAAF